MTIRQVRYVKNKFELYCFWKNLYKIPASAKTVIPVQAAFEEEKILFRLLQAKVYKGLVLSFDNTATGGQSCIFVKSARE